MKSFTINKNDADQRLDKFILKVAPKLPKNLMYKYIRIKRIKVNGKKSDIKSKLNIGDTVDMYINDEFFESVKKNYDFLGAGKELCIVYEDENIIIADKKPGILCHPDKSEFRDTLITRIMRYLYEKNEYDPEKENSFTPALCNRIDRNTGGLVICAKNAEALRIINEKIKLRELKKRYLCIVIGKLKNKEETLYGYLLKNESKNQVTVKDFEFDGSKKIITKYKVLEENGNFSLVDIDLLTGRTHQIRAHMAHIGHPLLGDTKYGNKDVNREYNISKQALYSYKIICDFETDAGVLNYLKGKSFEAPSPEIINDFHKL